MTKIQQSLHINLRQEQRFFLTMSMQKALSALQLPLLELGEWLKDEIMQNPLLEYEEPLQEEKFRTNIATSICSEEPVYQITLFESLMQQAGQIFEDEEELEIAKLLIGNLDERGFLTSPLSSLTQNEAKAQEILEKIQGFDPPGIAARDLRECLLIQLRRNEKENSLAYKMIEDHFDDLLHHRLGYLQKQLKCPFSEIQETLHHTLALLDFHPGQKFQKQPAFAIYPDLILKKEEETWHIEMNEQWLPQLKTSPIHLNQFEDEKQQHFLKYYQSSYEWLRQALERRKQTLHAIASCLIQKQGDYLSGMSRELVPMTMQEVADELGLHESTIARAVSQKYVFCPQGLFLLRHFFTAGIASAEGKNISNDTCKQLLLRWIQKENKQRPYSDNSLSLKFKRLGVSCARRTVSKYRNALKIPSALRRRAYQSPCSHT